MKTLIAISFMIVLSALHAHADQVRAVVYEHADQVEVGVVAASTYKADAFYLSFTIRRDKKKYGKNAVNNTLKASKDLIAKIQDAGINISELESSSILPETTGIYDETSDTYEGFNFLTIHHRMQLKSYKDYIHAHAILAKFGIWEEDLKLDSRSSKESELVRQTFRKASQAALAEAEQKAQQNNMILGLPLLVQASGYHTSSGFSDAVGMHKMATDMSTSDLEALEQEIILSDEIEVSVSLGVFFEWHAEIDQ